MGIRTAARGHWDVSVITADGALLLAVEAKNLRDLNVRVAQEIAQSLIWPESAYLLVASQDRGHLWAPGAHQPVGPPAATLDLTSVVRELMPRMDPGERLPGQVLELVLCQWLGDLCDGLTEPDAQMAAELHAIGLLARLRGCDVQLGDGA